MSDIEIRRLGDEDSLEELTALLHRGYAQLGALGFNYKAVDQSVAVTRSRIAGRECYVVVHEGVVVGTAVLSPPELSASYNEFYNRPDVSLLSQLAIEPRFQGRGWGSRLMSHLEARAAELGAAEIAVDTAENAHHLVGLYERRGYRYITHAQWGHARYVSVILSKRLSTS